MHDIVQELVKMEKECERNERRLQLIKYVMEASDGELERLVALATEPEATKHTVPPLPLEAADRSLRVHTIKSLCGEFEHVDPSRVRRHEGQCKKCKAIKTGEPHRHSRLYAKPVQTPSGMVWQAMCGKLFPDKQRCHAHMGRCKKCRKKAGLPRVVQKAKKSRRKITCGLCGAKLSGAMGLGIHLRRTHNISTAEYRVKMEHKKGKCSGVGAVGS
jgi:hypothetical protein